MKAQELQSFAERNGFRWIDGCAYGVIGEYPLLFRLNGGAKGNMVVITLATPGAAAYKAIKPALKSGLNKIAAHQMMADGTTLMVTMQAKPDFLQAHFANVVNCVISACRDNGVKVPETCPICGLDDCGSVAHIGQCYRPVHKACLTGVYSAAKATAEENQINGNFFTGIIGAILGGIVGCIPNLLSLYFAERFFAILYALIPLGIFYGYKLLNGRMNKAVKWITVALSAIFAVGIEFAMLAIYMIQAGVPLGFMGEILSDGEFIGALAAEIPMSLLFVAIGIGIAWSQISRTVDGAADGVGSALATIMPYGDVEREIKK